MRSGNLETENKKVDLSIMSAKQLTEFIKENNNITPEQFNPNEHDEETYAIQLSLVEEARKLLQNINADQNFKRATQESANLFRQIESKKDTIESYVLQATQLLNNLQGYPVAKESIEAHYDAIGKLTEGAQHNALLGETVDLSGFEKYIKQLKTQLKECEDTARRLREQQEAKQAEDAAEQKRLQHLLKEKQYKEKFAKEEENRLFNKMAENKQLKANHMVPQLTDSFSEQTRYYKKIGELIDTAKKSGDFSEFDKYVSEMKNKLSDLARQKQEKVAAEEHKKYSTHHGFFSDRDLVYVQITDGGLNRTHTAYKV